MPRISGAIDLAQVSSPLTPVSGRSMLYVKSDGLPYSKGPDGIERTLISVAATYASLAKWGTE